MKAKTTTNNRKHYRKPHHKKEQKTLLNSAAITPKRDTEVLKEDLFSEVILDASGQDSKLFKDRWVLFFEEKQSFLKGLMAYVNNSHTLRNTLQNKRTMVMGDGFVPIKSEGNPVLQTFRRLIEKISGKESETEQLNDLIASVNIHNETLEAVLDKVVFDFLAFGNAFVELKKVTIEGVQKVMMYHVPVYMVALEKMNQQTGKIDNVGICQDWENLGNYEKEFISVKPTYPKFDEDGCSVIHVKNYAVGFSYWGLPEYIAARHWAEIEYRIPKYNISKFKNGFVPSSLIQFYGNMTNEEAQNIIGHVEESFTDTGKNSKMMVQVLRDPKYKADVQLLEDTHDGSYMDLAKLASQALVTANRMTMSTAGFATSGSLGSNQQMLQEIEFVTNTSIKGIRRKLLQEVVNPFIKENAEVNTGLDSLRLDIANMNPVSFATSLNPANNLLINEQRRALGFDALDEETLEQLKNEKLNGTNNSTGDS